MLHNKPQYTLMQAQYMICGDQPIMFLFLPIMLCCSALKIYLLYIMFNIMFKNKNYGQTIIININYIMHFMYKFAEAINYM